jgi:hypothetical protein
MLHWYGLTRRFTLLRSYNGDPIGPEDLKTKSAEQRARGAPNQVSEEEGMILKALVICVSALPSLTTFQLHLSQRLYN